MSAPDLSHRIVRAAAAAAVVAALAAAAILGYGALVSTPVKNVVFAGSTERIPAAALEALARDIREAPAHAPLAAARAAAKRVPWVREATVRRGFPDTVEVRLETYEPLAYWNEGALLSRRGEIFSAPFDAPLPHFRGADAAAPLMAREYPALAAAVAPLSSPISELRLSARGGWHLTLESGIAFDLGRADLEARIARFVSAWPELAARGIAPTHADLRYANGFALRKTTPNAKDKQRT